MLQVTSPTSATQSKGRSRIWSRAVVVGALVLGLVAVASPSSSAEDLYDQRDRVRKSIAQTKDDIADGKKQVAQANAALAASQKKLDAAQAELSSAKGELSKAQKKLADTRSALAKAKARDVEIAAKLKVAQDELAASIARGAQGEADLAAQTRLIGSVVRTAYQQQSSLASFAILLDASSADQVANRIQWTEMIFGNTAGEMDRLQQLQVELEAAKVAQTAAEAKVARQREESQAQLSATQRLTDQARQLADEAAKREATVSGMVKKGAGLVAENRKLRDEAQDELEADKAQYDKLQAQEESISKKIKEQIAKDNASGNQRVNAAGFIRPIDATPGSPFGLRYHPILHYWRMHWGQDFGARCGAPIWAMADGKVTQILRTSQSNGLGNWTVIDYGKYKGDHFSSGYAHQSKIIVKVGQEVKQGQIVGYVGTTGLSTGCHLHLQIYKNGARVNPRPYV